MGALSFASPLILSAMLALPAIWWLLRATPPAPVRKRFPPFEILRRLNQTEETPDRTPWWLLALRLLLAALIIFGLAGPILNAPAPADKKGPIVFVVDDGWAAADTWRLRRNAILEGAEEAAQSQRSIFIITTTPMLTPATPQMLSPADAREIGAAMSPNALSPDRAAAAARFTEFFADLDEPADIRWLSDGVASAADAAFAKALADTGSVKIYRESKAGLSIIRPGQNETSAVRFPVERLTADEDWNGELVAIARDGRELARSIVDIQAGERRGEGLVELPLAFRNELAFVRLANVQSAGALQLIDARNRRALVGLVSDNGRTDNLLSGAHYIRQALRPYAEFVEGDLATILSSDATVVILDDVGRLRKRDADALSAWVESGGVLIRFAGSNLADAAQDQNLPLLPAPLRGGGRSFGGALTWETPQRLSDFSAGGPFDGLTPPADVLIRRQVLAQPGGETAVRSWARLTDGTPLVTGVQQGDGAIALFHTTATPEWSDLPISGIFVELLRRLMLLSNLGVNAMDADEEIRYAPARIVTGEGRLMTPPSTIAPATPQELDEGPAPGRLPGLYGPADAPLALNAVNETTPLAPLSVQGVEQIPYVAQPPRRLASHFFLAAFIALLMDGLLTLLLSGRLPFRGVAAAGFVILTAAGLAATPAPTAAQPLDQAVDIIARDAALETRLAFVRTGDPAVDRISEQGLAALSRQLYRRTSVEPAPPTGVDLGRDDLSLYPFLYWPITADATMPDDAALANVENFMRFGGLILFDTRDDERAIGGALTPEREALRRILGRLDIPPLEPVDTDHVLARSFFLIDDLHGRVEGNPVWVQAEGASAANDGVTPVIIGGRDWAGAWATNDIGQPSRPMGVRGYNARELSYRAGINIVMVAFTGNYKSDQVHTPILLERLGR
ncbi:MAG: DUF4159 domain-containing protein [Pseudomonadota bacterium]